MNPRLILFVIAGTHGGIAEAGSSTMGLNFTQWFTRFGKGLYLLNLTNEFKGALYPTTLAINLPDRWELFVQQYDGDVAAIRATIADSTQQLSSATNSLGSIPNWVASSLSKTLIEMVNEEFPLTAYTISAAMEDFIAEMVSNTKTVKANTVTITTSAGSGNVGNGVLVTSLLDGNGKSLEYIYQETLPLVFTSTFTAGAERCNISGTLKASSMTAQDWPAGSGANSSFGSLDAASTSGSKIVGGAFDTFTSNTPVGWILDVGTAGTQFFAENSVVYKGANALKIAGDGSTLSAFSQSISPSILSSKTPYALNFWAKVSAAPAAGVLTVDLFDGTSTIVDESSTANSFTVDLTTLGTTYVPINHVFRLSEPLPATVKIRFRLTTALSNSKSLYIDQMTLQPMQQLYSAGPFVALASGNANWSLDDSLSIAVTNDYAGQIQTGFWRCFNMPSLGLILPSSGSPNVADSFIS